MTSTNRKPDNFLTCFSLVNKYFQIQIVLKRSHDNSSNLLSDGRTAIFPV